MSITSISIENFKSIRDRVTIDLKPITLLFGPNSAGKSTIIQALHYAWEVIGRHNLDPNFTEFGGREMDLGGFENLVYGHDLSRSISIRLDMDISTKSLPVYTNYSEGRHWYETKDSFDGKNIFIWNIQRCNTSWIEIKISWNFHTKRPYVAAYEIGLGNERIAQIKTSSEENKTYISYINFFHHLICSADQKYNEKAFKEIGTNNNSNLSDDYKRASYFKYLIDSLFAYPDEPIYSELLKFDKCAEIIKAYQELCESDEKHSKLDQFMAAWKKPESSEKEKEDVIEKIKRFHEFHNVKVNYRVKEKLDFISYYDLYAPFFPYEFFFFCSEFLLIYMCQDLDIELGKNDSFLNLELELDQNDSLPVWDRGDFLKIKWILPVDNGGSLDDDFERECYKAISSAITQFIISPGQLIKDELHKLRYLGPIRSRIPRNYVPNRYIEKRNWPNGEAAWDVLYNEGEDIVEKVDFWMFNRLDVGYRIFRNTYKHVGEPLMRLKYEEIIENYNSAPIKTNLLILDWKNHVEVQPPDVGVGISQVIPVIVSALYFKDGIVSIEQPELHIHPALQVALGDLFISQIQEKGPCFILETHSEHLMLRFLRRIRETSEGNLPHDNSGLVPDQLAIYYIEPGENGLSVSRIRVDQDGEFIDHWPRGFFNERVEELY